MSSVAKFLIQGKKIDFELYEKNGMCWSRGENGKIFRIPRINNVFAQSSVWLCLLTVLIFESRSRITNYRIR